MPRFSKTCSEIEFVPMIDEAFFVLAEGVAKAEARELVAAGRLGRKAGRGVYEYA